MQRQFVMLSSEATVSHFFIFVGRLIPQLITSDSGGQEEPECETHYPHRGQCCLHAQSSHQQHRAGQ
eukprot:9180506-Lingulodinium_polyedra.AAC.1